MFYLIFQNFETLEKIRSWSSKTCWKLFWN